MAGVLDAKSIAGTATGDMGFGVVADVAVVVACLVAFVGFLEAKPITATGDVGCGVVAAAAGEGVQGGNMNESDAPLPVQVKKQTSPK